MNYIESLKWRYATKKFNPERKVAPEVLERIMEAAGLTATSLGLQAMKIIRVENKNVREELLPLCYNQKQIVDASELLVLCSAIEVDESTVEEHVNLIASVRDQEVESLDGFKNMMAGYVNSFTEKGPMQDWLAKQAYIMMGTILTACAIEKVDSCPMEGFQPKAVSDLLSLKPKGLTPVLILPIGYRSTEDKNQHLPKVRKPLKDFVATI